MANEKQSVRALAHSSLLAVEKMGRYSNLEIDSVLKNASDLTDTDRGLYTRLVYGVIERRLTLDHIISQYSARKTADIDLPSLISLRLGIYQLVYMDRIPDFAAVGESVDTAPKHSRGFVNGVLRSFIRAGKKFSLPNGESSRDMSIKHSTTEGICKILCDSYGYDTASRILEAYSDDFRVCLRVNTTKISVSEAAERLGGAKICDYSGKTLQVTSGDETVRGGIDLGLWFVQDEASAICTSVVGARRGERIADVCSAPGGKSFGMAIDAEGEAEIFSFDLHDNKLSLIRSTASKLGLSCISTSCRDARKPDEALANTCDRVLCDAPCSGFGVLAKKPDIRYKDVTGVARLPEIQYGVLCGASTYVKDGGVLVYSTCTLNRLENEAVVEKFLAAHPEFTAVDFTIPSRDGSRVLSSAGGCLTLLPHVSGTDGFFVAKMLKTN